MKWTHAIALALAAFSLSSAGAQEEPPKRADKIPSQEEMQAAEEQRIEGLLKGIHYTEGTAQLPGDVATLQLPQGFRYLEPGDARKVIVDLWGNPADAASDILGLVVPAGEELDHPDSWAIVVSFNGDGYVSDHDADEIDYSKLLEQMKEGSRKGDQERKEAGFPAMNLVGWAVPPRYDKDHKVLYWAREFHPDLTIGNTVNYDVRVLGRRGVLSLNGVAGMDRIKDIEAATPAIVQMAVFNAGERYQDFDPKKDKKSAVGLAGLVLGGAVAAKLAAKVGLFKGLIAALVAGKKLVAVAVIAIAAFLKKIFGRKEAA